MRNKSKKREGRREKARDRRALANRKKEKKRRAMAIFLKEEARGDQHWLWRQSEDGAGDGGDG